MTMKVRKVGRMFLILNRHEKYYKTVREINIITSYFQIVYILYRGLNFTMIYHARIYNYLQKLMRLP